MNAQGGSSGQANSNNQYEGFPQPKVNFPQQDANNNVARTDAPLHGTPSVVVPESNISSSSLIGTPPNRLENVDLSLNFGLISLQGATISPSVIPSTYVAPSLHGSNSNSVNIPRKRSLLGLASGEFHQGESSNMGQETGQVRRLATESQVTANNTVNPPPPSFPLVQQQHQFLRGHHVDPNNAGITIPQHNVIGMTNTNQRRGSHGPIPSQASLHFNRASTHFLQYRLQPSHSVRPPSFHSRSFMSSPASSVNNITVRNAPPSISSPYPHSRVDVMISFHEHGNNMFGPVVTSMGNFPTYPRNRSYVDAVRDTARRGLSFVLPDQFEPSESETMHLLNGSVGNVGSVGNAQSNMNDPLNDHASPSTRVPPQGSRGMHHSAAASSSGTRNHHTLTQISSSAISPNVIYEPAFPLPQFPSEEARRRLPSAARSLLGSLRDGLVRSFVEFMFLDYSNGLHGLERQNPGLFQTSQRGLSVQTITQYMERESFLVVDGDDSQEQKEKCPICLQEFVNGEEMGKLHSCVHKFHFDCIKKWLKLKNMCPVCRRTALKMQNVRGRAGAAVHDEDDSE